MINYLQNKSFTLIEILVVVAIVGILSGFIFVTLSNQANRAQDAKIVKNIDSLNRALLSYYHTSGTFSYPIGETCLENDSTNTFLKTELGVSSFPQHPNYNETNKVCYYYQSGGSEYSILVKAVNGGYIIGDSINTKVESVKDSCDTGWIKFGNRCIMQYEAKNVGGVATSQADGIPWVSISQTAAQAACEAIGAHLITNAEWMAIARDIEMVDANWTGGSVGSGMIKRGNVGTTDAGSYDGSDPEYGTGRDTKAQLTLSNGETIWDFSGNVWEWVDMTKETSELPNYSSAWRQFNSITYTDELPYSYVGPIDATLTSTNGVGQIYTDNNDAYPSGTTHAFRRGGRWDHGADAGVFALSLYYSPASAHTTLGFRCAR